LSRLAIPTIKCIEVTDTFGRFVAEPLEKGFVRLMEFNTNSLLFLT